MTESKRMEPERLAPSFPRPSVISYEKWVENEYQLLQAHPELVECHECCGVGEVICACCGQDCECDECHSEGEVMSNYVDLPSMKKRHLSRDRYHSEVSDALKRLAAWCAVSYYPILAEYGFTVFSSLPSKTEIIRMDGDLKQ